jgi:hypothetical protein
MAQSARDCSDSVDSCNNYRILAANSAWATIVLPEQRIGKNAYRKHIMNFVNDTNLAKGF